MCTHWKWPTGTLWRIILILFIELFQCWFFRLLYLLGFKKYMYHIENDRIYRSILSLNIIRFHSNYSLESKVFFHRHDFSNKMFFVCKIRTWVTIFSICLLLEIVLDTMVIDRIVILNKNFCWNQSLCNCAINTEYKQSYRLFQPLHRFIQWIIRVKWILKYG